MEPIDDSKLYFHIDNIGLIKTLGEILGKITDDIRISVQTINEKSSLEISCTNKLKTFFFKSNLNDNFIKKVHFNKSIKKTSKLKIDFGVGTLDLLNVLKSVDKTDDYVVFCIKESKPQSLTIKFCSNSEIQTNLNDDSKEENEKTQNKKKITKTSKTILKKNQEKKFSIDIYYPEIEQKQITKIEFDKKIIMSVDVFHKTCKDLGVLFDCVNISSKNNNTLSFAYDSGNCDGMNKFDCDNIENSDFKLDKKYYVNSDKVVLEILNKNIKNLSGTYSLDDINNLSKLTNFTSEFYIWIKNNFILQSNYILGIYGFCDVMYVPKKNDDNHFDQFDNLSNYSVESRDENNVIESNKKKIKKNNWRYDIIF